MHIAALLPLLRHLLLKRLLLELLKGLPRRLALLPRLLVLLLLLLLLLLRWWLVAPLSHLWLALRIAVHILPRIVVRWGCVHHRLLVLVVTLLIVLIVALLMWKLVVLLLLLVVLLLLLVVLLLVLVVALLVLVPLTLQSLHRPHWLRVRAQQ
jgi:hypothetical protein